MKDIFMAVVIGTIWIIWHYRNKSRSDNINIPLLQACNMVKFEVSMIGNASQGYMSNSVADLRILK